MDSFRCPTCLTLLLEGGEVRCPACKSKLRKRRSRPIILGRSNRLSSRPMPGDRVPQTRAGVVFGADARGRDQLAQVASIRGAEPAPELVAELVLEPTPQPTRPAPAPTLPAVMADLVFEREPEPEAVPHPEPEAAIDLPAEHAADLRAAFVAETTPEPAAAAAPEPPRHLRPAPVPDPAPERPPLVDPSTLDGAVNDMVAELNRKARADRDK
jgi:hypothetical protein